MIVGCQSALSVDLCCLVVWSVHHQLHAVSVMRAITSMGVDACCVLMHCWVVVDVHHPLCVCSVRLVTTQLLWINVRNVRFLCVVVLIVWMGQCVSPVHLVTTWTHRICVRNAQQLMVVWSVYLLPIVNFVSPITTWITTYVILVRWWQDAMLVHRVQLVLFVRVGSCWMTISYVQWWECRHMNR